MQDVHAMYTEGENSLLAIADELEIQMEAPAEEDKHHVDRLSLSLSFSFSLPLYFALSVPLSLFSPSLFLSFLPLSIFLSLSLSSSLFRCVCPSFSLSLVSPSQDLSLSFPLRLNFALSVPLSLVYIPLSFSRFILSRSLSPSLSFSLLGSINFCISCF